MLPNHAPLVIAEQFGTLAALFPGRIDLGLGRAPGTDPRTALALRRHLARRCRQFPAGCSGTARLSRARSAGPGGARHSRRRQQGAGVDSGLQPLWRAAGGGAGAALRLRLAFRARRSGCRAAALSPQFQPSPYAGQAVCDAGAECVRRRHRREEAQLLFTSLQQAFVNLRTGQPGQLPPPWPGYADSLEPRIADMLERVLRCAIVGGPAEIAAGLDSFIAAHRPDEIMVTAQIFDAAARRTLLRHFGAKFIRPPGPDCGTCAAGPPARPLLGLQKKNALIRRGSGGRHDIPTSG